MKLIAITPEYSVESEAETICLLRVAGFDRIHIRKPSWREIDIRHLVDAIPTKYYPSLSIHDYHNLALEYKLGGIHLNSRNPVVPDGYHGLVSRSCHSFEEAASLHYDYCFLSPVFDSISKNGYRSAFSISALQYALVHQLSDCNVVALGGVSADNIGLIQNIGFRGAAMLGGIWSDGKSDNIKINLDKIIKWRNSNI